MTNLALCLTVFFRFMPLYLSTFATISGYRQPFNLIIMEEMKFSRRKELE